MLGFLSFLGLIVMQDITSRHFLQLSFTWPQVRPTRRLQFFVPPVFVVSPTAVFSGDVVMHSRVFRCTGICGVSRRMVVIVAVFVFLGVVAVAVAWCWCWCW